MNDIVKKISGGHISQAEVMPSILPRAWKFLLRRLGFRVSILPYPAPNDEEVVIVDVGVNKGQFLRKAILNFPRGKFVGFEPQADLCGDLKKKYDSTDIDVTIHNMGLGSVEEQKHINIASNSGGSSFLPVTEKYKSDNPEITFDAGNIVEIRRLDKVVDEFDHIFILKIDVEGYEEEVLGGASGCLPNVEYIILEFGLNRYQKQISKITRILHLIEETHEIVQIDNIHNNSKNEISSFDVVLRRIKDDLK